MGYSRLFVGLLCLSMWACADDRASGSPMGDGTETGGRMFTDENDGTTGSVEPEESDAAMTPAEVDVGTASDNSDLGVNPIVTDCLPGQFRRNGACIACSEPAAGQYVAVACASGADGPAADTVFADCTGPINGQFVAAACVPGSPTEAGADTAFAPCGDVPLGHYVTAHCEPGDSGSVGSTTETEECMVPMAGEYVTATCQTGDIRSAGTDTTTAVCSEPIAGHFVTKSCDPGSPDTVGTDTVTTSCAGPDSGHYVATTCVAGDANTLGVDTQTIACSEPSAGEYVSTACVAGDANTLGNDTQTTACSEPGAGEYVSIACVMGDASTAGSDTQRAACTMPADGEFVTVLCRPGTAEAAGQDTQRRTCATVTEEPVVVSGSSEPIVDIPDADEVGIRNSIELAAVSCRVREMVVSVDITHPVRPDIDVTLITPKGRPIVLTRSQVGENLADLIGDFPGDFDPLEELPMGAEVDGSWTLWVQDKNAEAVGRLNSWGLTVICDAGTQLEYVLNACVPGTASELGQDTTFENPIEHAIRVGDVGRLSEHELLRAMAADEVQKVLIHQARWRELFDLDENGDTNETTLRNLDWNPSHDSVGFSQLDGRNVTRILVSNDSVKKDGTQNFTLGLVGELKQDRSGRYALLGANPFHDLMRNSQPGNRPGGFGNDDLTKFIQNTLKWLGRGEMPQRIVLAHLTDSFYFQHDETVPFWFAEHLPDVELNDEDTCENGDLAGCLENTDLLILSQDTWERDTDVDAVLAAVRDAQNRGLPVLYVQSHRNLSPLGEALMSYFGVAVTNNYWRQEQMAAFDAWPTPSFEERSLFLDTLARQSLQYADYESCGEDPDVRFVMTCQDETFLVKLANEVRYAQRALDAASSSGRPFFSGSYARYLKMLVLLGDRYRIGEEGGQPLDYPIDWRNDPAEFARAVVADHTVVYTRATAPAQPDLGTFVCPNDAYADGSCTGYDIAAAPRAERTIDQLVPKRTEWTTTGLYILPGHPITVTRTDETEVPVALRFNSHWPQSTRSLESNNRGSKYNRPQYLSSPYIQLERGSPVTITSPYGGAIYVQVKGTEGTAGQRVTATVQNVGRHAALLNLADDDAIERFLAEVRANPIPYVDLRSIGFESHLRKDRFINAADNIYSGDVAKLFHDYRENFVGAVYRLAGFAAPGETVEAGLSDDVLALCDVLNWDCTDPELHQREGIQHANLDGSSRCGSGCSGNPFDGNWDLDPLGWGNNHELGHNLQVRTLNIAYPAPGQRNNWKQWSNRATENSNNIFPYHTLWRYERLIEQNGDPLLDHHMNHKDLWAVIQSDLAQLTRTNANGQLERVVYDASCRVLGTGPSDAENLRIDAIWEDGRYAADNGMRMSFYLQLPMLIDGQEILPGLTLDYGFDLITLLYAHQRLFTHAAKDRGRWNAQRDTLGFSEFDFDGDPTYGGGRVRDMWGNDFLIVSLALITRVDFRLYFDLRGVPYSDLASRQVDAHRINGKIDRGSGDWFAVLETDLPGSNLATSVFYTHLDGTSRWPRDNFHPEDCVR